MGARISKVPEIEDSTITYAKIQDVSATDKLLGRSTAGAGVVEEVSCTAFGRSLLDDTDAAAGRTTLGLGNSATKNTGTGSGDLAIGDHTHGTSYVHPNHTGDVTSVGDAAQTIVNKQTLTASNGVNVSNSPTVIAGAVPAISLTYGSTANTVCQGNDSRLSDARTPIAHTQTASTITDFDTEVGNNATVVANTSKVTNATHTGEVTGSTALTIANDAVTYAKMQNVSAGDKVLGRSTAGPGSVEEIVCTATGRALIGSADAAAARTAAGVVIGTDVQVHNANLTGVDQSVATTGSPAFASVTSNSFQSAGANKYSLIPTFGDATPHYPPAQDGNHIKATSSYSGYTPFYATDPALSKTGGPAGTMWFANGTSNQRLHIDLGEAIVINKIYYENAHQSGGETGRGIQHFTFWGSNSSASFDNTTYSADAGWTQISTGVNSFERHVNSDVVDPKYIYVTNSSSYRYYAVKIEDNYGGYVLVGVRHIELQSVIPDGGDPGDPDGGVSININGIEKARVAATGYMGIGVAEPTHILHINGQGRSTTSAWATSSDQRVKENIVDHEEALPNVLLLHPVRFNFKKDYRPDAPESETGFLAQEFEQVVPEAVTTIERENWLVPPKGRVFIPAEGENPEQELATDKTHSEFLTANDVGGVYEGASWEETTPAVMDGLDNLKVLNPSVLLPMIVKAIQELEARVTALEAV